jgi:BirA family transcriptional regulator, biotin operon repressor / biotin---[acetyl-CoA-carboxylase] ligase
MIQVPDTRIQHLRYLNHEMAGGGRRLSRGVTTIAGVASVSSAPRPPLDAGALREAVVVPGGLWRDIRVVTETGSTNSDLLAEARGGLAEGVVLAAETQSAGRGRMGRHWVSPPGAALAFSVLLRPEDVPPASRGWVPLLAGVAVALALHGQTVDAWLKWPNDVQVNGAKLAGILAEQAGDAIVVGTGINVSASRDELPAGATSLALEGARTDRNRLLAAVLGELEHWYLAWVGQGGDADRCGLRQEYQRLCGTLGRQVQVSLPGGATVAGVAGEVDRIGRLVVRSGSRLIPVSAGDVVHVR